MNKKFTQEEVDEMINPPKEKNVHYTWHNFCDYMKRWYYDLMPRLSINKKMELTSTKRNYRNFNSSKMVGYKAMCRVERYSNDKEDILITHCDDNSHMGSRIALITHECEDDFMGTTMILIPQSKQEINQAFLYPSAVDGLIEKLKEVQKRAKEKEKINL